MSGSVFLAEPLYTVSLADQLTGCVWSSTSLLANWWLKYNPFADVTAEKSEGDKGEITNHLFGDELIRT